MAILRIAAVPCVCIYIYIFNDMNIKCIETCINNTYCTFNTDWKNNLSTVSKITNWDVRDNLLISFTYINLIRSSLLYVSSLSLKWKQSLFFSSLSISLSFLLSPPLFHSHSLSSLLACFLSFLHPHRYVHLLCVLYSHWHTQSVDRHTLAPSGEIASGFIVLWVCYLAFIRLPAVRRWTYITHSHTRTKPPTTHAPTSLFK